jgi:hypothetical protein
MMFLGDDVKLQYIYTNIPTKSTQTSLPVVTSNFKVAHSWRTSTVVQNNDYSQNNVQKKTFAKNQIMGIINKYNLFLSHIIPQWTWKSQNSVSI